jgi:hypothetical protein
MLANVMQGTSLSPSAAALMRLRSLVGDYIFAVAVDGLFMASQYDMPWIDPVGGFMLCDQVRSLEFHQGGTEGGSLDKKGSHVFTRGR